MTERAAVQLPDRSDCIGKGRRINIVSRDLKWEVHLDLLDGNYLKVGLRIITIWASQHFGFSAKRETRISF